MLKKYQPHPEVEEVKYGVLELKILNNIWMDYELPKYKHKILDADSQEVKDGVIPQEYIHKDYESINNSGMLDYENKQLETRAARRALDTTRGGKLPFWKRWFTKFMQVDDTFKHIKDNKVPLTEDMKPAIAKVDKLIERANIMGQGYLVEQLKEAKLWLVYEQTLANSGFPYAVHEKKIIEFLEKSHRGVSIDYLKFYTAIIPDDVAQLKKKADELLIFDNYCVMHFDESRNSLELTPKQKEKAKDPIIFGMIRGSRKLYYVADWVIPDDDLTLNKFFETLNPNDVEMEKAQTKLKVDIEEVVNDIESLRNSFRSV